MTILNFTLEAYTFTSPSSYFVLSLKLMEFQRLIDTSDDVLRFSIFLTTCSCVIEMFNFMDGNITFLHFLKNIKAELLRFSPTKKIR